jgi:hypothetical protein
MAAEFCQLYRDYADDWQRSARLETKPAPSGR